ncbi:MAG: SPOR domain-containing protein [Chitinispirillales bacterium]|jgi:hypothetical protein|nr:SPOR domain-containing protein [Chitinispirillales bacterium]
MKFVTIVMAAAAIFFAALPASAASDHGSVVTHAMTLPVRDALRIIDSLSRVPTVAAEVRARCFQLLGDHRYIMEDYKRAAEFYRQAAALSPLPIYRQLYDLTIKMTGDGDGNFTVQAGAFGSRDNADSMVRRLSENYSGVTISTTTNDGQTLHRVRVGSFQTREEAAALAEQITAAGVSARVVEKY